MKKETMKMQVQKVGFIGVVVSIALLSCLNPFRASAQSDPALLWSKVSGPWAGQFDWSFGAIAVDPTNPNIIYIGSSTWGVGIYKSTDGGASWVAKNAGIAQAFGNYVPIAKIVISPSSPNIVYFAEAVSDDSGVYGAVYKSTDAGESWQRVNGQQNFFGVYQLQGAVYDFDVSPTDPNTVYAGVSGQGVMKTTDGGANWTTVFPGASSEAYVDYFNIVRILPSQPNVVFISGFTDYLVELPGIIWEENLETLPGTTGVIPMALRKSTDGGTTWNLLNVPTGPMLTDLQYENASGNLYASTISYKNLAPLPFGFVGNKGVFKSTDGGGNWEAVNSASFGNLDQRPFVALSANPSSANKGVFASTGFGNVVVATTDTGVNWLRLDPSLLNAYIGRTSLAGNKFFILTSLGIWFADISSMYAPPSPTISSVSPATLPVSSTPQLITIYGTHYLPSTDPNSSMLVFYDPGNNPYTRVPNYVNSGELNYNISVLSATGTWKVKVVNGNTESPLYTFTIVPVSAQLSGLALSGPVDVVQNTSGNQYTATALFSDGSTSTVTPTWVVSPGAPASISSSGQLTANSVGANTAITVTASYTYGSVTKTANYGATILKGGNCGYYVTNLIVNGDFESGSTGWTLSGNAIITTFASLYHSPNHYLWLGDDTGTDSAYYQTTIASTASSATLSLYYNINSSEPNSYGVYDTFSITVRDTSGNLLGTLTNWSNLNGTSAGSYQYQTFDLSAYAGKTVRIYFTSNCHLSGGQTTNFRVDDVGVIASLPNPVTNVLFGVGGPTNVVQGGTAQYSAIVVRCDNSVQSVTPTWSITAGQATINSSGFLTAGSVSADTSATVSANYPGFPRLDYPITIVHVAPVFLSLAISGPNAINENGSGQFSAVAVYSDGSSQSISPTWSVSSGPGGISSSGLLTIGDVTGNTTTAISASYTIGGTTHSVDQSVTIVDVPPPPTLSSLSISGPSSFNENSTAQYSAVALFSDGSSQVVSPTWSTGPGPIDISALGLLSAGEVVSNMPVTIAAIYTTGGITVAVSNSVTIRDVVLPTYLSAQFDGQQLTMTWITNSAGFTLEYSTNLPPVWLPSPAVPVIVKGFYVVTNVSAGPMMFFRLRK